MSSSLDCQKIAVIGAGISGLGATWLLSKKHDVTVFEADSHFGGHANTVDAETSAGPIPIDTGFIVCNDKSYPNFLALMNEIGVARHATDMSFSVSMDDGGFEYAGSDKLSELFAQPTNIIRPRFWHMLTSLLRFYKSTQAMDPLKAEDLTLKEYLTSNGYSEAFIRDHILPMAASIWSTPFDKVGDFPLASFLRFCQNHGLLQVNDRPQWYTIPGGSRRYVAALKQATNANFRAKSPVETIERIGGKVTVKLANGQTEIFDKVLIAAHGDDALSMLSGASPLEREILSGFHYERNHAVLHSDPSLMPRRKKAWASWNYMQGNKTDDHEKENQSVSLSYWMNKLQPLDTDTQFFVTLNPGKEPDPMKVHYEKTYRHPIFDRATLKSQKRIMEIMGEGNVWYARAHMGYGFHEDGLQAGLYIAEAMGDVKRPWLLPDMNSRIIALQHRTSSTVQVAADIVQDVA